MSFRNPFKHAPKKSVISRTTERDFERELKKLSQLEESTKKIHKDIKRCIESQSAQAKSESKIPQNLQNGLLYRDDVKLKELVDSWCQSTKKLELLMEELNATSHKAVSEPTKKFGTIFPAVQIAIKKREQSLQEYNKCQEKVDKYLSRERTGPNVVKLETSRKAFNIAKLDFDTQNGQMMDEVPRLYEGRIAFFQPSLQALIRAQIKYYTDSQSVYSEMCKQLAATGGSSDNLNEGSSAELKQSIAQKLTEIRSLSITTTDDISASSTMQ